jgi:hypothetical protein
MLHRQVRPPSANASAEYGDTIQFPEPISNREIIYKWTLFASGLLLLMSELSFFSIYFINLDHVWRQHKPSDVDEATFKIMRLEEITDILYCGAHFLATFISLSELLARLFHDIERGVLCDEDGWSPTWWLVSLVSVCVDTGAYIRVEVAQSNNLIRANALGNLINSALVFVWAWLVSIDLFFQYRLGAGTRKQRRNHAQLLKGTR